MVSDDALDHLERGFDRDVSPATFLPSQDGFDVSWQFDPRTDSEARRIHFAPAGVDSHATFLLADESLKRRMWHEVCNTLDPPLWTMLRGLRSVPATSAFLVKPPHGGHIPHGRTITAWVPFRDVDAASGCMRVAPGSHGTSHEISALGTRHAFAGCEHVVEEFLVDVPMKRGDVLILDDSVIHHSHVNDTNERRLAALVNYHPAHERSVFFQKHPDLEDIFAVINLTEDFFASLGTPDAHCLPHVPIGWVRRASEAWGEEQTREVLTNPATVRLALAASPGWTVQRELELPGD